MTAAPTAPTTPGADEQPPALLRTGEIAIISCLEHVTGHTRKLRALGIEPVLLGPDPHRIPGKVRVVVARLEGSAHRGTAAAHAWVREGGAESRTFLSAKGAGRMMKLLRSKGFIPADDADEPEDEDAEAGPPQRADFAHDGAFFAALLTHTDGTIDEEGAKVACTEQGVSFKGDAFAVAHRIWRAAQGLPPLPESQPEKEDAIDAGVADDRQWLNDILIADQPSMGAWVKRLIDADPAVTSVDMLALAAEQGVYAQVASAFSRHARAKRAALGLGPFPPRGGILLSPLPVCWTESMGEDPAGWPKARIRPIPTIEDLRTEIQLWTDETERLRRAIDSVRSENARNLDQAWAERVKALEASERGEAEAIAEWTKTQRAFDTLNVKFAQVAQHNEDLTAWSKTMKANHEKLTAMYEEGHAARVEERKAHNADIEAHKATVNKLAAAERELERVRAKLAAAENAAKALEAKVATAKAAAARAQNDTSSADAARIGVARLLASTATALEDTETRLEAAEADLTAALEELTAVPAESELLRVAKEELARAERTLHNHQETAKKREAENAAALAKARDTIASRERACAEHKARIEHLETSAGPDIEMQAVATALKQEVQALKQEITDLTRSKRKSDTAAAQAAVLRDQLVEARANAKSQARAAELAVAKATKGASEALAAARAESGGSADVEAVLRGIKDAQRILRALGPNTPWEKLEAVLRITLDRT